MPAENPIGETRRIPGSSQIIPDALILNTRTGVVGTRFHGVTSCNGMPVESQLLSEHLAGTPTTSSQSSRNR